MKNVVGCLALALAAACGPSAAGGSGGGGGGGTGDGPDGGAPAGCQANDPSCNPGGGGGGSGNCDTEGNDLIYVVDTDSHFLSFNPTQLAAGDDPFTLIGSLDCPAGPSWSNYMGPSQASPFSMSVDRDGNAWVLYTSGEIFKVSITDASCTPSGFQKGQNGMQLFGMGYVADSAGSTDETLYMSGGSAAQDSTGNLAKMKATDMSVSMVGALPDSEYGPELTGNANGELYAYFPGSSQTYVAQMSTTDASVGQTWDMEPIGDFAEAWAFAHWGGKFYVFITTTDGLFTETSEVKLLDPSTGNETTAVPNSPYKVVGAGVSTCAPVEVD